VIDSNVFPQTRAFMIPLERLSRQRTVRLFWSPLIIAEAHRTLTWLWLRRHGTDLDEANWERCSIDAKAMFAHATRMFEVVDDRPPYPALWAEPVRDQWDVPIFTAARNATAHFVVTTNLRHGPPRDREFADMRMWDQVIYISPGHFLDFVNWTLDQVAVVTSDPHATLDGAWWLFPHDPVDPPELRAWKQVSRLTRRHAEEVHFPPIE
jgi:hypothetical protein